MSAIPPKPIQQQMYTRERRGIFRENEGYDTIARSSGLDSSFIKKYLHPFCFYDAPTELTARGEKDDAAYPQALQLYRTDTGQIVLGSSVYQSTDFTGLRSAFFMHNYIIPAERMEEVVKDYSAWLHASFATNYNIDNGQELPELNRLPVSKDVTGKPSASLVANMGINEQLFKQLLFAVMSSIGGRKKVYVALDVPIEKLAEQARVLIEVLYACLPYAYRRLFGFVTYAKEPVSRKGVHLTFVEKGSLRPNDRNVEKDYTFDLQANRVTNIELDWSKQPYLDWAWNHLGHPQQAEEFYKFAELMLADMDPARQTAIASYHELASFYQIEEGNELLYDANKLTVLRALLEYLSPPGAFAAKKQLNALFLTLFDREFELVKRWQVPDASIVECFRDYYRMEDSNCEEDLVGYLIRAINNAISEQRQDQAATFYALIESTPTLNKVFFDAVLNGRLSTALFEPYITERLHALRTTSDVMNAIQHWVTEHPQVLDNAVFQDRAKIELVSKLRLESEPVSAVNAIVQQLDKFPLHEHPSLHDKENKFLDELTYEAHLFLLTELNLEELTKGQLLQIEFLQHPEEVRSWAARFNLHVRSQAAVMLSAYSWFSERNPDETIFDGLSPVEMDRVQQLGRSFLRNSIEPSEFSRLIMAFYRESGSGVIDYGALMHFLNQNARNQEIVYQFMNWSEKHPYFVRSRKLMPAYAAAILSYFTKHDRSAFKNRINRKQYFESAGAPLQAVYHKAAVELSSPLVKLLRRNKKASLLALIIVLCIGTLLGLQMAGAFDKETPVQTASPETKPEPVVTPELPPVVVHAEQVKVKVKGVQQEKTQLVFQFRDAAACRTFSPNHASIEQTDGKKLEFKNIKPVSACAAPADKASATDKADSTAADPKQGESTQQTGTSPSQQAAETVQKGLAIKENASKDYPSKVTLPLGKKVTLAEGSIIRIDEQEYTLSSSKANPIK